MAPELQWRKSSYSGENGACVEIAEAPSHVVKVRDSKDTSSPVLDFTGPAWLGFITDIQEGRFNA
ncbi:DUF397 domain-containing protein [Streptomyces sp. ISL-44]|uniref:DUF397 domain-containing protein n=1 Tax=Streptomyces sp. ISL-44 TaxID=2819184 RepID=UPI001BEBDB41|nr:DUF397 domain-containing protein [Streptomyces sp. ISL-44]MBT2541971.1 DUF397 domain-containing protein [Streptomyces sp. ISL-44]